MSPSGSMPSVACAEAASIASRPSPESAFSTAVARNAFAARPVTPTRTLSKLLPFIVTSAATPTSANPGGGGRGLAALAVRGDLGPQRENRRGELNLHRALRDAAFDRASIRYLHVADDVR